MSDWTEPGEVDLAALEPEELDYFMALVVLRSDPYCETLKPRTFTRAVELFVGGVSVVAGAPE